MDVAAPVTVPPPAAFVRLTPLYGGRSNKRAWGWGRPSPIQRLHEHVDGAAAGESDRERLVVGVPEGAHLGLAGLQNRQRLSQHGALDATAGDRPGHLTVLVDGHGGPGVARP